MAHELADWLRNAAPETLESLGLHRKGEESHNQARTVEKSQPVPTAKRTQRSKPRQLEHNEQVRLFQELEAASFVLPDLGKAFAIPNGGKRNAIVAKKLKAEGVKAGTPDICLPVMRGGYGAMWVEFKVDGGRPTDAQKERIAQLRSDGYYAIVCYGWESALSEMIAYVKGERVLVRSVTHS